MLKRLNKDYIIVAACTFGSGSSMPAQDSFTEAVFKALICYLVWLLRIVFLFSKAYIPKYTLYKQLIR